MSKEIEEILSVGNMMSNAIFNLSQRDDPELKRLKKLQIRWDKARKEINIVDFNDVKLLTHITKIVRNEVSVFNGWRVDEESEEEICRKAATKILRYINRKFKK